MKSITDVNNLGRIIILLLSVLYSVTLAQPKFMFVNYAPGADKSEGDNNYIQVINIRIPENQEGKAFLRLFDMSCGSKNDIVLGSWNSTFKFSLYQGELREKEFKSILSYKAQINERLISHFETGKDPRYYDQWYTFVDLTKNKTEKLTYSLVVEGISGDDGNRFQIFVSSDSTSNQPIKSVEYFTDELTIALKSFTEKISFRIDPLLDSEKINIHTFDMDGTKAYLSTLLKDEVPLVENNNQWNIFSFYLTEYERNNYCSFDLGPQYQEDNDITFYITEDNGSRIPFFIAPVYKQPSAIPVLVKNMQFNNCISCSLDFSESSSPGGSLLSFKYSFEDGFSSIEPKIIRTFEKPGKYIGEVLVVNSASSAITKAKLEKLEIVINEKPVAVSNDNLTAALEEKILFDASKSADTDGKIRAYSWDFGDGSTGSGVKVNHSYFKPGKYIAILRVEDDYPITECNYAIDTTIVTINSSPVAVSETKVIGSINQKLIFDASMSSDSDGFITKYIWDFGKLGSLEGKVIEMSFPQPGSYSVQLTVVDNSPALNNKSKIYIGVIINDPPKANAGNDLIVAQNESVLFNGSKSIDKDGHIINYTWDFGNGIVKPGEEVYHAFSEVGNYRVKLTIEDNSATDSQFNTDSILVVVNDQPVAKIENEKYLNDGIANFDASGSHTSIGNITQWIWDYGDGTTGDGKVSKHIYQVPGKYRVILKVVEDVKTKNNFAYDTSFVIFNRKPVSDPGPDRIITTNGSVKFDGSHSIDPDGNIKSFRWYINEKLISEEITFEHKFADAGIYTVSLEVKDDFFYPQTGISHLKVKVNSPPIPRVEYQRIAAPNQKVKFDAAKSTDPDGTIKQYLWKFSDGIELKGNVTERAFKDVGSYRVILTLIDDAGVDNSTVNDTSFIKINSSPIIKTERSVYSCTNVVTLDASKSIDPDGDELSFLWVFPNNITIKGGSKIQYDFRQYGIVPVNVVVDDGLGLQNSVVKENIVVNLHQPPLANAGIDTTVCAGDIVIFNGLKSSSTHGGVLFYEWTFSDSVKLYGSSIFRTFKKGGTYSVLLKVKDDSGLNCDEGWDSKIIEVIDAPIANAGEDISACANKPLQFNGSKSTSPGGVIASYNWDFGDGENGAGLTPIHIYDRAGKYKVTLTITGVSKGKCDNTAIDDLIVTVSEAPVAKFKLDDVVPINKEITIDASQSETIVGKVIGYTWNFGDGTSGEGKTIKHKFTKSGIFNVLLNINTDLNSECNSSSTSKQVVVNSPPVAKLSVPDKCSTYETVFFDASASLDNDGKIREYIWDFGDGTTESGIKVAHHYSKGGHYKVSLTVIDNSGIENNSTMDYGKIFVNTSPIAEFQLKGTALLNDQITLDGSSCSDSDGKIKSFAWYLNEFMISDKPITKVTLKKVGLNKIKLKIADDADQLNSTVEVTHYIMVSDIPK